MPTKMEEIFEKMTPEQRKEVMESLTEMMGMPPEEKLHIFKGVAVKIVIESEDGMLFIPPAPGQEIKQRVTINRNGSVTLTRYFSGDYSKVPPTADTKTIQRFSGKHTEQIMDRLAQGFSFPYIQERICDAGMWGIMLMNTDGEKFYYHGSLGLEPVILGFNRSISEFARQTLGIDALWMFENPPYNI